MGLPLRRSEVFVLLIFKLLTASQGCHLGGGAGWGGIPPSLILKNSDFLFLPTNVCIFHIPPPSKKSVKILPPWKKLEMTSLLLVGLVRAWWSRG